MLKKERFLDYGVIGILIIAYLLVYPGTAVAQEENVRVVMSSVDLEGAEEAFVYSAQEGETLRDLAEKLGFDLGLVAAMNNLSDDAPIYSGQVLMLPNEDTITYEVKQGDTLWGLARHFGVSEQQIVADNDIFDISRIYPGQRLSIHLPRSQSVVERKDAMVSRSLEVWPTLGQRLRNMLWPTEGVISSHFGRRWGRDHEGLDIAADMGTPIVAILDGKVTFSGRKGTYGKTVILDHGGDLTTLYAHASRLLVVEGDEVKKGETIARVGNTGRSTGPHLHFEVRHKEEPRNPYQYLSRRY